MNSLNIDYRQNTGTIEDVKNHLLNCNNDFVPPLLNYINMQEYADKIIKNATNIEAWHNEKLIGLVAVYLNNKESKKGFITNVSVESAYNGKGIATELLKRMEEAANKSAFFSVFLDVNMENVKAIKFYKKCNFNIIGQSGVNLLMEKILQ